jgi:hypothetical protein
MEDGDQTLHGYQLVKLHRTVAELVGRCPGLVVLVEWTGENETTAAGRMPTVQYTVNVSGGTAVSEIGVTALPARLADALRRALHEQRNDDLDSLIDRIEECPVL